MTKDEVFVQVRSIIGAQFNIPYEAVTLEADLYEDLKFDSLDTIDLMIGVEKLLKRRLGPDVLMDVRTVGDAVNEIYELQAKAA